MKLFDASYQHKGEDTTTLPANHGKRWTETQEDSLRRIFNQGNSLQLMCYRMGRAPSSILARLCFMHLLKLDEITGEYFVIDSTPTTDQPTETTSMSTIATIEQRTLINGTNAADMSDKEIFKTIAKLESEVRVLEAVNTKPKKLVAAIAALQADIEAIVAYVDERV